eukprot:TRINITY_DN1591_c0_g1_i1.p1 TRINITY_DN1591_c0_g1~~TRINITY_DN1591_c0_g1_i1.p1  ORF type:complete len:715 (-),score=135.95 TRINITY_DN1591_c0_g1_i1:280-2424(-)
MATSISTTLAWTLPQAEKAAQRTLGNGGCRVLQLGRVKKCRRCVRRSNGENVGVFPASIRQTPASRHLEVSMTVATPSDGWGRSGFQRGEQLKSTQQAPRELLAQRRRRKELERMQREQQESQSDEDDGGVQIWPFWKRKKGAEYEGRKLTRKIMELSRKRQLDQIFSVLVKAKGYGKQPNLITMNAVMAACVHCDDIDRMLQVYDDMCKPGGVGVDTVTYGTLLKGLGQAGRLDDAFEVLESMEAGTAPGRPEVTEVHINTLMNACAEAGEAMRARGILRRQTSVDGTGGPPTTFSYNLLIKGYARSDNPLEALAVVDEMKARGLPLQRLTYNSLILACVRGGDLEKATSFLEEMKAQARTFRTSRLLPDVVTYTTLLQGVAEEGDIRGIRSLAAEMKEAPMCVLDRVAYSAIIDACITAQYPEEGLRILGEMETKAKDERELRPRAHVYLALMRALAEKGDVGRVRSLAVRMQRDAAGRVWPEDLAEADELAMESAVRAGKLDLARDVLLSMNTLQKGRSLSERALPTFIRLFADSPVGFESFQPLPLRPEVSLRACAAKVMQPVSQVAPLLASARVGDVVMRFLHADILPVVDDSDVCIGTIHVKDCGKLETKLADIVRPLGRPIPKDTSLTRLVSLLLLPDTDVLAIANCSTASADLDPPSSMVWRESDANDRRSQGMIVGFVFREDVLDLDGAPDLWAQAIGKVSLESS